MSKRDKTQIIAIGILLTVALGVLVYIYRENFIPKPDVSRATYAIPKDRPTSPVMVDTAVFQRQDFRDLTVYGPGYDIKVPPTAGADFLKPSTEMTVSGEAARAYGEVGTPKTE